MMELQTLSFPLFCFFLFLFVLLRHCMRSKARGAILKLPPGPRKLPLIGNLHQVVGPLLHHTLRNLAKRHGPVMHLQLGEVSAFVISSPEAAKKVMKTHDVIFGDRPFNLAMKIFSYDSAGIVFAPYGSHWRRLQKICVTELLSAKKVQSFKSIREEEVSNLIESISLSGGLPINLSQKIYLLTNSIISRATLGKKHKDHDEYIRLMKEGLKLISGFEIHDIFPSFKFIHWITWAKPAIVKFHQKIDEILEGIIEDHKAKRETMRTSTDKSSEEDLVDVLLKFQEHGNLEFPITTNNIKAIILDMFAAGTETSASTIEWAISEMMRKPRVMEKAQAEVREVLDGKGIIEETDIQKLDYLKLVIKETLRLHPPAPFLIRSQARERCEINGYEVPVKTNVFINAYAIGRDPEHWIDAESFEPERFLDSSVDFKGKNFEFIPFGAGRRMCPGILFAITSIELSLAQLLFHFDWKLPNGIKPERLDMTETFGATTWRRNDLHLLAIPYIPSSHEKN